ncbi:hypothetical protein PV326_012507 [Microctonus aethiopoides]|nr:hypothetical protein PV326_012507 [Microctonus aethiopoides]
MRLIILCFPVYNITFRCEHGRGVVSVLKDVVERRVSPGRLRCVFRGCGEDSIDVSIRADCAPSTPGCTSCQVVLLTVILYWGKGWEGVDRFTPGRVYANPGKDAQYVH